MSWMAVAVGGSALLGAGTTLYGANKQSKAIDSANAANLAATEATNKQNYEMWLRSRGVGANGQPVNYVMPEWLTVNTTAPRRLMKKGETAVPVQAGAPFPTVTQYSVGTAGMPTTSVPMNTPSISSYGASAATRPDLVHSVF